MTEPIKLSANVTGTPIDTSAWNAIKAELTTGETITIDGVYEDGYTIAEWIQEWRRRAAEAMGVRPEDIGL